MTHEAEHTVTKVDHDDGRFTLVLDCEGIEFANRAFPADAHPNDTQAWMNQEMDAHADAEAKLAIEGQLTYGVGGATSAASWAGGAGGNTMLIAPVLSYSSSGGSGAGGTNFQLVAEHKVDQIKRLLYGLGQSTVLSDAQAMVALLLNIERIVNS